MSKTIHFRFNVGPSALVVTASTPEGRIVRKLERGGDSIDQLNTICDLYRGTVAIRSFSAEDDPGTISLVRSLGREIYSLMFKGAEDLLEPGMRLLFEHDVFLFPLELAYDGDQFVGHKYATDNWIRRVGFQERPEVSWPLPKQSRQARECLFAGAEDRSLVDFFARDHHWKTGQITQSRELLNRLRHEDVAIFHFAGHASYDAKDSENSSLSLLEGKEWDGVKCLDIERSWRNPPRLVFLNACFSGDIKDDYRGLVGLAGAFLRAGVSRCVTTSWSITDDAAAAVARSFYTALLSGNDTAEALRRARLQCWAEQRGMLTSLSYVLLSRVLSNPTALERWVNVTEQDGGKVGTRRIFISHSHADQHWADQLAAALRQFQVTISGFDKVSINAGSDWKSHLRAALEEADGVVFLLSPHFLRSTFICEQELPLIAKICDQRRLPRLLLAVSDVSQAVPDLSTVESLNLPSRPLDVLSEDELSDELKSAAARIAQSAHGLEL